MFGKLRELLGMQQPAKAGKMGAKGAVIGAVSQMPQQQLARPMQPMVSQKAPLTNRPTFAGNLNPGYEDGYDTTIRYMQGSIGKGRNPVDMGAVPTNFTAGRTGFYQGSNPYVDGQNWVDPQMQDFAPGGGIQSPSFGAWQPRKRY